MGTGPRSSGSPRNHGNRQHPGEARAPGEWPAQRPSFGFRIRTDSLAPKGAGAAGYDNVQATVQGPTATRLTGRSRPAPRRGAGPVAPSAGADSRAPIPPPPSVSPRASRCHGNPRPTHNSEAGKCWAHEQGGAGDTGTVRMWTHNQPTTGGLCGEGGCFLLRNGARGSACRPSGF